ncbi:hypothetical protein K402DRAFT_439603 [Aulographum hederae CBS 113979]|uniref:Uncharacterized protein n=1 Tax=Aulographum hederae CBS 113979 TaxID=1176131 RepID=A0A6G1GLL0_9PEZI|nr:hypothetical protein K402DRAFT_439603 [Aulographum hederae CBS 113979]
MSAPAPAPAPISWSKVLQKGNKTTSYSKKLQAEKEAEYWKRHHFSLLLFPTEIRLQILEQYLLTHNTTNPPNPTIIRNAGPEHHRHHHPRSILKVHLRDCIAKKPKGASENYIAENDSMVSPRFLSAPVFRVWGSQLREDAIGAFIRTSHFIITAGPNLFWFRDWLKHVDGWKNVRSLEFPYFDCFSRKKYGSVNGDMKLVERCTGLRHLTIMLHVNSVTYMMGDPELDVPVRWPRSCEDILWYYELWKVAEGCKMLETLTIETRTGRHRWSDTKGRLLSGVLEVKEWFELEFERRTRRKVLVRIYCNGELLEVGGEEKNEGEEIVEKK